MDAAEYKHLVLGLIFLKYISDTFVEQQQKVLATVSNPESDYYLGDDQADQITRKHWKIGTITPRRTCSGCLPMPVGNR